MKRDIASEILSKKRRTHFRTEHILFRLDVLEDTLKSIEISKSKYNYELYKYFPISLVACAEYFFRTTFKELIDYGSPFFDRVEKLNKLQTFKLDLKILQSIQGKEITVGELISHILPLNNLNDIESTMSILINRDFLHELRFFEIKEERMPLLFTQTRALKNFKNNYDKVIKDINATFELRHVYCHELPLLREGLDFDKSVIVSCFKNTADFLIASSEYVTELLQPNYPLRQGEMNEYAAKENDKAQKKMEQVYINLMNIIDDKQKNDLEMAQEKWGEYRNSNAELAANFGGEGGTIWPMLYSYESQSIIEERTKKLEQLYEFMNDNKKMRKQNFKNSG